jgi:hypothetical protein
VDRIRNAGALLLRPENLDRQFDVSRHGLVRGLSGLHRSHPATRLAAVLQVFFRLRPSAPGARRLETNEGAEDVDGTTRTRVHDFMDRLTWQA